MKNNSYRTSQILYLKQHYADLSAAHFAELWGITVPKVYALARRCAVRKRAPNGQPIWRQVA
ncbi:MAG: hypothetical protein EOO56_29135 [Hymenobacter sp.]|nr:MAG: hypothetical protein EOO56_29135 [Hymenobacter sp.]